jgi:hypothetical protein
LKLASAEEGEERRFEREKTGRESASSSSSFLSVSAVCLLRIDVLGVVSVVRRYAPFEHRFLLLLISVSTRRRDKSDFEVREEEEGGEMKVCVAPESVVLERGDWQGEKRFAEGQKGAGGGEVVEETGGRAVRVRREVSETT